jgi:hypothetical protein
MNQGCAEMMVEQVRNISKTEDKHQRENQSIENDDFS